ncbi:MAG: ABC-F family ATP-binding cassette domain-containing protein, partial [Clostridiales bacterium]|nr:ABC-F family ATP-binding cassette domain-containing protein [Clostridiales bacterium]
VDLEIKKDDRIVILGPNGSGKTTLIRILLGQEMPDEGFIRWGSGVKIGYLPQIVEFRNENISVLDCVVDELNISVSTARNWLGGYYFRGEEVFKSVRALSGGEKSRLRLCILMYRGVNMLILDEPTNHLDIRSSEWIEEAISKYEGTLLVISHDRFFINRVGKKIWSMEDGTVKVFEGGYEEYKAYKASTEASKYLSSETGSKKTEGESHGNDKSDQKPAKRNSRSRESVAARKRLRILENEIEKLENELEDINREFERAATDHIRLTELMEKKAQMDEKMASMLGEWEDMMNLLETAGDED